MSTGTQGSKSQRSGSSHGSRSEGVGSVLYAFAMAVNDVRGDDRERSGPATVPRRAILGGLALGGLALVGCTDSGVPVSEAQGPPLDGLGTQLSGSILDVRRFAAESTLDLPDDASGDASKTIQAAIDQAPISPLTLDYSGTFTIQLPSTRADGTPARYRIDNTLIVDGRRQIALVTDAPIGAALVNNTNTPWIIQHYQGSMSKVIVIDGLVFHGGGHRILGSNRGTIIHRNCKFFGTSGYAISYEDVSTEQGGFGVVYPKIYDCEFWMCAGAVRYASATAVFAHMSSCNILYSFDYPIRVEAPLSGGNFTAQDVELERCNFESVSRDHDVKAFVWINELPAGESPSRIRLIRCRFGAEGRFDGIAAGGLTINADKPMHDVMVGDPNNTFSDGNEQLAIEVEFQSCEFLGKGDHASFPRSDNAGRSAVGFYAKPFGVAFTGYTVFRDYHRALIEEPWTAPDLAPGPNAVRNWVGPYSNANSGSTTLFEDGKGSTWKVAL